MISYSRGCFTDSTIVELSEKRIRVRGTVDISTNLLLNENQLLYYILILIKMSRDNRVKNNIEITSHNKYYI